MTDSDVQLLTEETKTPSRLFIPSLAVASFTMSPPMVLFALLRDDMGLTFNQPLGVVGQLETVSLTIAAITALLMGAWSIRFDHKSLLLMGLTLLTFSALGIFFAFNFSMLILAYALTGLGYTMIQPMTYTLVGKYLSPENRASAIGWLSAGMASAFLVGSFVVGFMAKVGWGDWRLPFLVFAFPVSLLGLVMVAKGVPTQKRLTHSPRTTKMYREGFKKIFGNRSATACIVGTALLFAGWQAILIFSSSFFENRFLVSRELKAMILFGTILFSILGTLVISRFVNRFGKKTLTVITAILSGIFIIAYMNVPQSETILQANHPPNFGSAVTLCYLGSLFFGMLVTTSTSLTLEQVPQFRGTMMSTHVAAWSLGAALGMAIGGSLEVEYELTNIVLGYKILGLTLGLMILAAALVFYFLAHDPTRGAESHH